MRGKRFLMSVIVAKLPVAWVRLLSPNEMDNISIDVVLVKLAEAANRLFVVIPRVMCEIETDVVATTSSSWFTSYIIP